MGNTIDSCFEEWKSFCLKCNYDKAYDCFIKVLSVAPDFNLFWSKIESSYSMKGYYLIFFNRYMDTILDDLNSKLVKYNDLLNIDENILYELNNYVFILRKCLILSSKTKQWAIIYKLLGNIYCTINNYHEAYECYKSALYFSKTIGVKSQFHNLAKKYGANDKINDDKFEYCLINNIHFKTINKWQCTPLRIIKRLDGVEDFIEQKSNKPKFYSNGRIVNVEKLVIDYYNEHGYRAYHCEGGVINFLSTLVDAVGQAGNKFLVIIDEWDAPIRENPATQKEYLEFLRSLFKNSGVTSKIFAAAYMTGILPIKKDGSQSAISDFEEFTVVKPRMYAQYIGFTEEEVYALCTKSGVSFSEMKRWYDGYSFKQCGSIYNPNSVMKAISYNDFDSYWTETSAAKKFMEFITMPYYGLTKTVAELIGGVDVKVDTTGFANDLITFRGREDVLTLLIHLGYLAYDSETKTAHIPNEEIRIEFQEE